MSDTLPPAGRTAAAAVTVDARASELVRRVVAAGIDLSGVYIAGGVVRDGLLGRSSRDLDLVVEHTGESDSTPAGIEFGLTLVNALNGERVADHDFGTITVSLPDIGVVDIATARTERYPAPGVLPVVNYVGDVRHDLARRDVSVNALALPAGALVAGACQSDIVDLTGGLGDVSRRVLRVLHDDSFFDDPTRIFRVLRYQGELDDFAIEQHTSDLLDAAIDVAALATISPQRRATELRLIWRLPWVAQIMALLGERGVTEALGLPRTLGQVFGVHVDMLADLSLRSDDRRVLSAAFVASAFPTSGDAREWFRAAEMPGELVSAAMAVSLLDRACDDYERVPTTADSSQHRDALLIAALAAPEEAVRLVTLLHPLVELAQVLDNRSSLEPQLSGHDLHELGVPDGPIMGKILRTIAAGRRRGMLKTVADEQQLVRELIVVTASKNETSLE